MERCDTVSINTLFAALLETAGVLIRMMVLVGGQFELLNSAQASGSLGDTIASLVWAFKGWIVEAGAGLREACV